MATLTVNSHGEDALNASLDRSPLQLRTTSPQREIDEGPQQMREREQIRMVTIGKKERFLNDDSEDENSDCELDGVATEVGIPAGDIENFILDEDDAPDLASEDDFDSSSSRHSKLHPVSSNQRLLDDSQRSAITRKSSSGLLGSFTSQIENYYDDGLLSSEEVSNFRSTHSYNSPENTPPQVHRPIVSNEKEDELDTALPVASSKGLLETLMGASDRKASTESNGSHSQRSATTRGGFSLHKRTATTSTLNSDSTSSPTGMVPTSPQQENSGLESFGQFSLGQPLKSHIYHVDSMSSIGQHTPLLSPVAENSPPKHMCLSLYEAEDEKSSVSSTEHSKPAKELTEKKGGSITQGYEDQQIFSTDGITVLPEDLRSSLRSSVSSSDLQGSFKFGHKRTDSPVHQGPKMYSAVFGSLEHGSFLPQYQASFQKKWIAAPYPPGLPGVLDASHQVLQPLNVLYFPIQPVLPLHLNQDVGNRVEKSSDSLASSSSTALSVASGEIVQKQALLTSASSSFAQNDNSKQTAAQSSIRVPSVLRSSSNRDDSTRKTSNCVKMDPNSTIIQAPPQDDPGEMFRPSSDAYTPRLKKAPTYKRPATRNSVGSTDMGTLSRPNFRDALRRVSMILQQHITKIERRFDKAQSISDSGLFLPAMRDCFHEDNFVIPTYKCTMVRIPTAPTAGVICVKKRIPLKYKIPTEEEIYEFGHQLFKTVQLSSECSIVCLIYIERLMEIAKVPLLGTTWRPIFMAGLLMASKVWQDLSSWNIEFASVYPQYSLEAINKLELLFLKNVKWDLYISSSLYAKYYFALRSILEKQDFRNRYNRMVGAAGHVDASQAMKIQKRTEMVKEEALMQLSKSM